MTERQWLDCTDPQRMLNFLEQKVSHRKLRLFACACCRLIWDRLGEASRRAVEVAEGFADGQVDVATLRNERRRAWERASAGESLAAWYAGDVHAWTGAMAAAENSAIRFGSAKDRAGMKAQCHVLRDLFGNPFRLVYPDLLPPETSWLTRDVVELARTIYEDRAFHALPVLADALTEAGCNDGDILDHCRQPEGHVPGCWVVDLVSGRE